VSVTVRIAVLDDYQKVAREYADWDSLPDTDVEFMHDHIADHHELVRRLEPFEVIAAMRERTVFSRRVLEALPKLKLLITTGMGNASIDLDAARDLGITVCGTAGSRVTGTTGQATAELTWGLILALARGIPREDRGVREGGWQRTVGTDLGGHTLGVVGLGRLGFQVAAVGRAFDMNVLAWSENLTEQRASEVGARAVDKQELFRSSDVISIHLVLSDRTRGLITADDLALMRPTAFLVNTSRGPIVDEAALREALQEGRIAGAGLDVFSQEPLPPDDPWRSTPRTVLTPHLGYVTQDTYARFFPQTVECISAFLAGTPVRVLT
jgi:phosphoglycerate dehydrogenase-like enzyme